MKKVICIYDGIADDDDLSIRLTVGKIYDVVEISYIHHDSIFITIEDNIGDKATYLMNGWFKDAKPYLREEKLGQLGI